MSEQVTPGDNIRELIAEARKASTAVYLATDEMVADDLSRILRGLADALESRVSPVTREALADAIEAAGTDWNYRLSENLPTKPLADEVADVILSRFTIPVTPEPTEVTDEMVERAAEAAHEATRVKASGYRKWGTQLGYIKDRYRVHARAGLEAVLGVPVVAGDQK